MFYQSIKIPNRYKIKEMFSPGDVLTLKYKVGVDEYGNDIYYVMDKSAIYKDGVKETGPIIVKYVQNDNTLTLERPVDTDATDERKFTTQVIPNGTYYDYIEVGTSMVKGTFNNLSHLYIMSKGNIKGKAKFYVDGVAVGTFGGTVVGNVTVDGVEYKVWKVSFDSTVRLTLASSKVRKIAPVVGPVISILSPTFNSAASQRNSATPILLKYLMPLPT